MQEKMFFIIIARTIVLLISFSEVLLNSFIVLCYIITIRKREESL